MDLSVLFRPEVIIFIIILALIGFKIGKIALAERVEQALGEERKNQSRTLKTMDSAHADTLEKLREGHAEELNRVRADAERR